MLWLALLLTVPLPFFLGALGCAPALRLFFLTGLTLAVVATEGAAGYLGTLALLGAAQSLIQALVLYLLAALLALALERIVAERLRPVVLATLVAGLLGLSLLEIYQTPLSSRAPYSNLAGLLD